MQEVESVLSELLVKKRDHYKAVIEKEEFLKLYKEKQEEMDKIKEFNIETVVKITSIMLDMGAITSCYFDKFDAKLLDESQGW